jgi:phosphoenolpyruvate carboxylase
MSVCDPLALVALFQEKLKGEDVLLSNRLPSTENEIFVTPMLSEAVPVTRTVFETVAPVSGELIATVGGVVSPFFTLTVIEADFVLPAAS